MRGMFRSRMIRFGRKSGELSILSACSPSLATRSLRGKGTCDSATRTNSTSAGLSSTRNTSIASITPHFSYLYPVVRFVWRESVTLACLRRLRHRRTADACAGFFYEYFEAEQWSAFASSPKVHVPLHAQIANVRVHGHVQKNRVNAAVLTLAKGKQRLGAPFSLVWSAPNRNCQAGTFHYFGDSERNNQQLGAIL